MTQLCDIREASRILGVSEKTIRRLIESGELNPVRIRSALRFRSEDLAAFVERHVTTGEAA